MNPKTPVWDVSADRTSAVYHVGKIPVGRVWLSQFAYMSKIPSFFGEAFVTDECDTTINSGTQGPYTDLNLAMLGVMEVYPDVLKRIGNLKLAGTCTSCYKNPRSKTPRACPFSEEVNRNQKMCSCCDDCRQLCQDSI